MADSGINSRKASQNVAKLILTVFHKKQKKPLLCLIHFKQLINFGLKFMCRCWSVYQASQDQHSAEITLPDQTSCTHTIEYPNWFNIDSRTLI